MKSRLLSIPLFGFYLILTTCAQNENTANIITINSDSCIAWNLPNLNMTLQIPKDYNITYNSSGGFYLQAHKYNDKNKVIAEISIGRIEGPFNSDSSIDMLRIGDNEIRMQLEQLNQDYDTRFIGLDTVYGVTRLPQLRNYIHFENLAIPYLGTYYGFTCPILLDEKNRFMISSMFSDTEKFSDERMIGIDLIEVLKSVRPEIQNK